MTNEQLLSALHLIQELSEVQKALTKLLMFGPTPIHLGITYNNIADIKQEMNDVQKRWAEFSKAWQ